MWKREGGERTAGDKRRWKRGWETMERRGAWVRDKRSGGETTDCLDMNLLQSNILKEDSYNASIVSVQFLPVERVARDCRVGDFVEKFLPAMA